MTQIRKATLADIPHLIRPLAEAFAAMPLTIWLLGEGPDALRRGERSIQAEFDFARPYDLMFTTAERQAVALWYPPAGRFTFWQNLVLTWRFIGVVPLSRKLPAQLALWQQIERVRPETPHYYLRLLAVAPAAQGQGVGSALLRPILEICDRDRVPAYLETDTDPNVRFYERHGFRVRDVIPIRGTNMRMRTMWREPNREAS
jgi:GNAT superfamily N-acetyltransferase